MTTQRTTATQRATTRGVDLMEINPRPLRSTSRMRNNNPSRTMHRAWSKVFQTLDQTLAHQKSATGEK